MKIGDWISGRIFHFVHGNNLVYNTCWEDPRLDRTALQLTRDDNVMVITSAGCNALDYVLDEPNRVHAVDMNPRQNALLELKLSGIRHLDYDSFFQFFGCGHFPDARSVYKSHLRADLSEWSQKYWDRWIKFFDNHHRPFYFRGTSGIFARILNTYIDRVVHLRPVVENLLSADSVEEQREIYNQEVREQFWTRPLRFAMGRDTTLSLVGVPRPQRYQVERNYEGGIVQFIQDCLDSVFACLPLADNYFWRVYMTGHYTPACCPEYLKAENFRRLKSGLVDRIDVHTNSVQGFLDQHDGNISRFVLLDHMDWLSTYRFAWLEAEWQSILNRATPDARILWRSGGLRTDFVDRVQVLKNGQKCQMSELLTYDRDLAARLHAEDRVHTYGSFYIADLAA
jgi:S-adenosylmethionine-diacylglycerol 3-amino-3-carboxypropyl transferase